LEDTSSANNPFSSYMLVYKGFQSYNAYYYHANDHAFWELEHAQITFIWKHIS